MQYRRDRYGNELSVLGYGCMRFRQKVGGLDIEKAEKEILTAFSGGVNYFDTAYVYPGSESALGEILERNHIRDQVYIATKLPHYMIKSTEMAERYFQEELRRLRTDHVDYYLMHMLTDVGTWNRLKALGLDKWLKEKKEKGEIGQVGFSYHGNSDAFVALLDAYDWDFCQIQYNYMDENTQAGRTGLAWAGEKEIPVIIMEPLRGGRLAGGFSDQTRKLFESHPSGRTPAQWSFLWLWNQPEVTVVLSGMNSVAMVEENIRTADQARSASFSEEELSFLKEVAASINARMKVGCTGCRYCMPCPHGVDIPGTFNAYNQVYTDGKFNGLVAYFICTSLRGQYSGAAACIGCGRCEKHCPQGILIREELKNARRVLEGPVYKVARKAAGLFFHYS